MMVDERDVMYHLKFKQRDALREKEADRLRRMARKPRVGFRLRLRLPAVQWRGFGRIAPPPLPVEDCCA